jgi:hypothetical protein
MITELILISLWCLSGILIYGFRIIQQQGTIFREDIKAEYIVVSMIFGPLTFLL